MNLSNKLENDLREAIKSKNLEKLSVLRLLKSAIKNAEISKGSELGEAEVLAVLEKQAKQRKDSIEQFEKGGRSDLAEKEMSELTMIETYLPQKMTEEETMTLVSEVISEQGATSIADMGKVIKEVMAKAAGRADGSVVSKIVKEKLS